MLGGCDGCFSTWKLAESNQICQRCRILKDTYKIKMLWLSWPRERIQNALTPCRTLDDPQKDEMVLKKNSIRAYNHSED